MAFHPVVSCSGKSGKTHGPAKQTWSTQDCTVKLCFHKDFEVLEWLSQPCFMIPVLLCSADAGMFVCKNHLI